ncbi:MAG: TonB-dependent receptor [Chromatiales bacterium]|nr:TonB-dependent receptor [Chromatiales bacterium]
MFLTGTAIALLLAAQNASVQGTPAPGDEAKALPEIIVTARRLPESIQVVPVSVTAFDSEAIGRLGATSLDELARFTPGFSFNSAAGRGPNSNRPTVRGLTTIRNGIDNSTVAATFIDGIYLGGSSQSVRLYDIERVEVLRGPQSAQFGRATYAGAINYITRTPGETLAGGLELTGAEHDTARASGWLGGPLWGDWLRFLVSAGMDTYGGEYTNTRDGSTTGGEESTDLSLKLEATPSPDLRVGLRLALQKTDDDHFATWLQPRTANNCCFREADAPRAREYFVGRALRSDTVTLYTDALEAAGGAGFELDRQLGSLNIAWDLPGAWTVSSLTGAVSDDLERGFDASYGAYDPVPPQPGSFLQRDELSQGDFSQELRVASPRESAWRGTGGLYYYRGHLDEVVENRVVVAPDGSVSVLPNFGDLTLQDVENRAMFGALEVDLEHAVTASLELRYAADEVRVTTVPNVGGAGGTTSFRATFRSWSPRLTVAWQASPALMPYLNIARGQSPGTFNPVVPTTPEGALDESYRDVDEEVVWNYELGLRGEWLGGRGRYALAAYYLDVTDQQFTTIIELEDGRTATILDNVGRTAVTGLEMEASAQLGEHVRASVNYAWTDSEIRRQWSEEQADLLGGNGTPEALETLGNVAGKKTPRVPEHMAGVQLEYRRGLGDGRSWFAGGDWSFESSRYAQEDNFIETGDRSLLGLRAGFAWETTDVTLWVTNLTDDDTPVDVQRYLDRRSGALPSCASFVTAGTAPPGTVCAGSSTSPRGFAVSLPRGRQLGATLRYRF